MVGRPCDASANLADLLGEFARRGDDEDERSLSAFRIADAIEKRQRESGGFARAGLRSGDQVASVEHERDRLLLDERGLGISQKPNGFQSPIG